jgi:hypothetical protein
MVAAPASIALALLLQTAPAPAATTPAEAHAAARRERIAAEQKRIEQSLAAVEAFGREKEFREELEVVLDEFGDLDDRSKKRWVRCASGWLPIMSVVHWRDWSKPTRDGRVVATDFDVPTHPGPVIVDLARQLQSRDVELLVVVFPSRIELYPELTIHDFALPKETKDAKDPPPPFRGMVGPTSRFLLELCRQGVEVLDLAPAFVEQRFAKSPDGAPDANTQLYLLRNQHWTPRGAELAAQLVAERLKQMPTFTPGPLVEGRDFEVESKCVSVQATGGGTSPDPQPELLAVNGVRMRGAAVAPDTRRRSELLLLSDSFAQEYVTQRASFVEQLQRFTGTPIDVLAEKGGAVLQCRTEVARRRDGLAGKKVVVWLLQAQNLSPQPAWQKVDVVAP